MRKILPILAATATLLIAPGCSDPGATTCAEFGAMEYDSRQETIKSLLKAHRLEPNHYANTLGAQDALDSFCGTTTSLLLDNSPATRNTTSPIDDAVDWDSPYW